MTTSEKPDVPLPSLSPEVPEAAALQRKRKIIPYLQKSNKWLEETFSFLFTLVSFALEIAIVILTLYELRGSVEQENALKRLEEKSSAQIGILQNLQTTSAHTATTLQNLMEQQKMATQTTLDQFKLFKRQLVAQEAEQAKKPQLAMNIAYSQRAYAPLKAVTTDGRPYYSEVSASAFESAGNTFPFALTNSGNWPANNGRLLITFESEFKITCVEQDCEPILNRAGSGVTTVQATFHNLRPEICDPTGSLLRKARRYSKSSVTLATIKVA
jgi:hypothetical protein